MIFFSQHAVVKAREAFSSERWEAKEAELTPKFVQTEAFPESAYVQVWGLLYSHEKSN